jgi:hypothetical protein
MYPTIVECVQTVCVVLGDALGEWLEVRRLNVEGRERLIQCAHDLKLRPLPISYDLEHASQSISCGVLDRNDSHPLGCIGHSRWTFCHLTKELAGHVVPSDGRHVEYTHPASVAMECCWIAA